MADENQGAAGNNAPAAGEQQQPQNQPPAPAPADAPLNIGESTPEGTPAGTPPAKAGGEGKVVVEYTPTGDASLDMALQFIGEQGLGPDHPAVAAAQNGDFGMLKAHFARTDVKGWEQFIALGEQAFNNRRAREEAKAAETRSVIENAVGGKEAWSAVQAWAKENAEPHEREAVNQAFAAGGMQAKAMAVYLKELYDNAIGNREPRSNGYDPDRTGNAGTGGGYALTPREYTAEVEKLYRRFGDRVTETPEYRALQSRRMAWRG